VHTWLDALLAFIRTHEAWSGPIVFVFAFFKSLAFVSLVVPATLILLAVGGLAGASGIDFLPIWIGVSLGAALGDWVSYAIGWRIKFRIRDIWPLSRHPELLPRGERFFLRYGVMSVVLCRFFSPLRATVPLLCGVFEMPWGWFQLANWLSAPLWAFALLAPGGLLAGWWR
jgi:membrane protein DedA with SNARE-associated domain